MTYRAVEPTAHYAIRHETLRAIPVVRWKLLEQLNRRIQICLAATRG
jgi:hypothetical protein